MKLIFNYCVYRIAKAYRNLKMNDYLAQGYFLMFFAMTCYLLTITHVLLYLFGSKLNQTIIIILCIPLFFEIIFFQKLFPNSEDVFRQLEITKANEKHKLFKGILVLIFLILSITSYVFVSFTLK